MSAPPPRRRTGWKLALGLFPFVAAAVAINLFLLFLMLQAVGIDALSPRSALLWSIPLAVPATWAAHRWVTSLIAQAERGQDRQD